MPFIVEADFGLWKASVHLGGAEYDYGYFGEWGDAERLLAVAVQRMGGPG